MLGFLTVLADALPDRRPDFGTSPTPYVVGMLVSMVVGILGHLVASKAMVALGIAGVFLAAFLLPLVAYLSHS